MAQKRLNSCGNDRVECPFFKSGTPNHINCESALSANAITQHYFKKKEEKAQYSRDYCCKDKGEGCVYYNAIMLRYEQE